MPVSKATKKEILRQKKEGLEQQYYNLSIEVKIAEELENERKIDSLFEQMAELKKTIGVIEGVMEELDKDEE